jgi:hypothetical protein
MIESNAATQLEHVTVIQPCPVFAAAAAALMQA